MAIKNGLKYLLLDFKNKFFYTFHPKQGNKAAKIYEVAECEKIWETKVLLIWIVWFVFMVSKTFTGYLKPENIFTLQELFLKIKMIYGYKFC